MFIIANVNMIKVIGSQNGFSVTGKIEVFKGRQSKGTNSDLLFSSTQFYPSLLMSMKSLQCKYP